MTKPTLLLALLTTAALLSPAAADVPADLRADAEIDPTAYALGGYSLHVGAGAGRVRVDLGAFALDVPDFVHGNDGFSSSFHGYGAKLQVFASPARRGAFAGIGLGLVEQTVRRDGSASAAFDTQGSIDLHVGWRFELPAQLYATAWIGGGRTIGEDDLVVDGEAFDQSPWTVFPAVHLGYRLR
jgi:hypothetical protein